MTAIATIVNESKLNLEELKNKRSRDIDTNKLVKFALRKYFIDVTENKLKNINSGLHTKYKGEVGLYEYQIKKIINKDFNKYYIVVPNNYHNGLYDLTSYDVLMIPKDIIKQYKELFKAKRWNESEDIKYYLDTNKFHLCTISFLNNTDNKNTNTVITKISKHVNDDIDKNKKEQINDSFSQLDIDHHTSMDKLSSRFTKREMACIMLELPYSGLEWLDKLIMLKMKMKKDE